MPRIHPPGIVEVSEVATISNLAAPTAAELNAGTDLTSFMRGVPSIPETGNTADISDLSSKFNKRDGASFGGDVATLECYRDDTTDTAYDTLTRALLTHVAVAWDGLATTGTWAISDNVWVYEARIISRGMGVPGRDEDEFFICQFAITDVPTEKFSIVA